MHYSEIEDAIHRAMYVHSHNPDGADYQCAFCFRRPRTNAESIAHDAGCEGNEILSAFETKDAEIARLRREADHRLDEMNLQARWTREAQEKAERADRRVATLREALKPFAEFGRALGGHDASTTFAKHTVPGKHALRLTGAHLHAALAALEEK